MIVPIPGFGGNAVAPTPEGILKLRNLGVFQANVKYYAGREHFAREGSFGVPWPLDGPAKFWANPNPNRAPKALFIHQGEDGSYIARKPSRNQGPENRIFRASQWGFYDARPSVMIPELVIAGVSYGGWGRLSFPEQEIEDPAPYPIAEVWNDDGFEVHHSFPTDCILFMENGLPYVATMAAAIAKFPYQHQIPTAPQVTPGGVDPVRVVGLARWMLSSANRSVAVPIINSDQSDQQKAAALLALK